MLVHSVSKMQFLSVVCLTLFVFIRQLKGGVINSEALKYLERYGYLKPSFGPRIFDNEGNEEKEESAFKTFQRLRGLKQTGILDAQTKVCLLSIISTCQSAAATTSTMPQHF